MFIDASRGTKLNDLEEAAREDLPNSPAHGYSKFIFLLKIVLIIAIFLCLIMGAIGGVLAIVLKPPNPINAILIGAFSPLIFSRLVPSENLIQMVSRSL